MERDLTYYKKYGSKRRVNGLQLPLNGQQVLGWSVLFVTGLLNFLVLTEIQFYKLKLASMIIYAVFYSSHLIFHSIALILDPGEADLRHSGTNDVPEFDRNIHAHVIENGRCHLCNINTSDKRTKHCGLCNKCVYRFDHHCKWLNSCVGKRNYAAFIGCVTTALIISLLTSSLCLTDIVMFFNNSQSFDEKTLNYINCTNIENHKYDVKFCMNSICFLVFLLIYLFCGVAVTCALFQLLCFHFYINILGISTYEYIVKIQRSPNKHIEQSCSNNTNYNTNNRNCKLNANQSQLIRTQTGIVSLMTVLIAQEIEKARTVLNLDRNKIHPSVTR
ncbi:palmitoyltransferase ZDHHC1 [Leptidea sinapis]|uniref:palmitoyltransferase ZDHHC1 n=1 Tax=Leptidea sinapis TaxID=189913 RepID=UPI0021C3F6FE|nr:palmitoyltransferase ZDHHC1 [Leptidea sinapis]